MGLPSTKYQTIVDDIHRQIRRGDLKPGERLPSQQRLAERYQVTVMTLRRALGDLQASGVLRAEQGSGTYVADEPFKYRLGHLSSFAQEMTERGYALTTEVLSVTTATDDDAREVLELDGEDAVRIDRRRLINGVPIVLQHSFLPARYGNRMSRAALEECSLYDLLADDFGVDVVRARETLRAVDLDREHARLLGRKAGTPAMLSLRVSFGALGRPVLFDRAFLLGDATEVVAERHTQRLQLSYGVTD